MARPPAATSAPDPISCRGAPGRSHRRPTQRGGIIARLLGLFGLLLLLGVVYLARHPLLRAAGRFWIVDETPQTSDAILVLGDDNYTGDRAARAAELYHAGWAPRVVASGRFLRPYASIAELMQRDLVQRGVPTAAVIRFTQRAHDTREEIISLSRLCNEQRWRHILLVTSSYHTRRARYIAERTLPPGTDLRVSAARDSDYDPDSWWQSRLGLSIFFHEVVGMAAAIWELRHSPATAQAFAAFGPRANRVTPCRNSQLPDWLLECRSPVYTCMALYYSSPTCAAASVGPRAVPERRPGDAYVAETA